MKKIFALILAIVMIASMSVVVFAEEPTDKAAGPVANSTILTYGVKQAYEVVIPASTSFAGTDAAGYTATGTLSATGVKIAANEVFTISVTSANKWTLVDTELANGQPISAPVAYDVKIDGESKKVLDDTTTEITTDYKASFDALTVLPVATPVTGNTGSVTLDFFTAGTGQEGEYQDTLTFVVAITVPTV